MNGGWSTSALGLTVVVEKSSFPPDPGQNLRGNLWRYAWGPKPLSSPTLLLMTASRRNSSATTTPIKSARAPHVGVSRLHVAGQGRACGAVEDTAKICFCLADAPPHDTIAIRFTKIESSPNVIPLCSSHVTHRGEQEPQPQELAPCTPPCIAVFGPKHQRHCISQQEFWHALQQRSHK